MVESRDPNALFCPACDYCLSGLAKNRCPECGAPFDPAKMWQERRAFAEVQRESRRYRPLIIWIAVGLLCMMVVGMLAGTPLGDRGELVVAGFVIFLVESRGIGLEASRLIIPRRPMNGAGFVVFLCTWLMAFILLTMFAVPWSFICSLVQEPAHVNARRYSMP